MRQTDKNYHPYMQTTFTILIIRHLYFCLKKECTDKNDKYNSLFLVRALVFLSKRVDKSYLLLKNPQTIKLYFLSIKMSVYFLYYHFNNLFSLSLVLFFFAKCNPSITSSINPPFPFLTIYDLNPLAIWAESIALLLFDS